MTEQQDNFLTKTQPDDQVAASQISKTKRSESANKNTISDSIYNSSNFPSSLNPSTLFNYISIKSDIVSKQQIKDIDNNDFNNFEQTISGLIMQVEFWHNKYTDAVKETEDEQKSERKLILSLQERNKILSNETISLYAELKVKATQVDRLRIQIDEMETQFIRFSNQEHEVLRYQELDKSRLMEIQDLRNQYLDLENAYVKKVSDEAYNQTVLNPSLQNARAECENWNKKFNNLQQQSHDLKENNIDLNFQIEALNVQQDNQIEETLRQQLEYVKQVYEELRTETQELKKKNFELDDKAFESFCELDNQKQLNALLMVEIENQDKLLKNKDIEINDRELQCQKVCQDLFEIDLLKEKIEQLNNELDHHIQEIQVTQNLNMELETKYRDLRRIEPEYVQCQKENAQLNLDLENKKYQLQNSMQKLQNVQIVLSKNERSLFETQAQILKLKQSVQDLSFEITQLQSLKEKILEVEKKNENLSVEITNSRSIIRDLQQNDKEISRQTQLIEAKSFDLENCRKTIGELNVKLLEVTLLHDSDKKQLIEIEELHDFAAKLKDQIGQAKEKSLELEKLNFDLKQRTQQFDLLEKGSSVMKKQNSKLQSENVQLNDAKNQLKAKLNEYINKNAQNEQKDQSSINEFQVINQRVESLQDEMKLKESQIINLNNQNQKAAENNRSLDVKLQKALTDLNQIQNQLQQVRHQSEIYILDLSRAKSETSKLIREFNSQQTGQQLAAKEQQIKIQKLIKVSGDYKENLNRQDQALTEFQEINIKLQHTLNTNTEYLKEIQSLNFRISSLNQQINELNTIKEKSSGQKTQNSTFQQEKIQDQKNIIEQLVRNARQQESEIITLKQTIIDKKLQMERSDHTAKLLEGVNVKINKSQDEKIEQNQNLQQKINMLEFNFQESHNLIKKINYQDSIIKSLQNQNLNLEASLTKDAHKNIFDLQLIKHDLEQIFKVKILDMNKLLSQKNTEIERLRNDLNKNQESLEMLKTENLSHLDQSKILNIQLNDNQKRIEQLQNSEQEQQCLINKLQELIKQQKLYLDEIDLVRNENTLLIRQISETKRINQENQSTIQILQYRIQQQELLAANYVVQIENKQPYNNEWRLKYLAELESRTYEVSRLQKDCEDTNDQVILSQTQIEKFEDTVKNLNSENVRIKELEFLIEQLQQSNVELQQKNLLLESKLQGFNEMKSQLNISQKKNQESQSKIDQLNQQLAQVTIEYQNLKDQIDSIEMRLALFASEIERQKHQINKKNEEILKLNDIQQELYAENERIPSLVNENTNINTLLEDTHQSLIHALDELRNSEQQISRLQMELMDKDTKIGMLSAEIERLCFKLNARDQEIQQLKDQIIEMNHQLTSSAQEILELNGEKQSLERSNENINQTNDKIQVAYQDILDLKVVLSQKEQELISFKNKLVELQILENNNESHKQMIQNLNQQLQQSSQNMIDLENQKVLIKLQFLIRINYHNKTPKHRVNFKKLI